MASSSPSSLIIQTLATTPWPTILTILFLALTTLITARKLYLYNRLRHIPGPTIAAFTNLWVLRKVVGPRVNKDYEEVCAKYGALARIGPNSLITSDSVYWRRVLTKDSGYDRSSWYDGMRFDPNKNNIFSHRDNAIHNRLRRKMAAGYAGKDQSHIEAKINNNISALCNLIATTYLSNPSKGTYLPMDLGRKSSFFTMDVITDIAFDHPYGFLESDSDVGRYIESSEATLPPMMTLAVYPWIVKLLGWPIFRPFLPSPKDEQGLGRLIGLAERVVRERWPAKGEEGQEKKAEGRGRVIDMVASFIRNGLTPEEAESELILAIIAGSDTTATAIRCTLLHLLTSPTSLTKLITEIRESSPSRPITSTQAKTMPYLQAVIREGIRIHPPVAGLQSKLVPPGGDYFIPHHQQPHGNDSTFPRGGGGSKNATGSKEGKEAEGIFIPGGTLVGASMWGMMRDTHMWGPDAELFRPERWLEPGMSEERRQQMETEFDVLFGIGRWHCLGKSIAMIELDKVFVELLRRFEFTIVNPAEPWDTICAGVFFQSNLWVHITERETVL